MSLQGILAGALGGLGRGASQLAEGYIQDARRIDVATELSKMEEEKQLRVDQITRDRAYADNLRDTDPTGQLYKNKMQGVTDLAAVETAAQKTRNTDRAETDVRYKNDPRNIEAEGKMARARNVETPLQRAQARQIEDSLDGKLKDKDASRLYSENQKILVKYITMANDPMASPEAREEAREQADNIKREQAALSAQLRRSPPGGVDLAKFDRRAKGPGPAPTPASAGKSVKYTGDGLLSGAMVDPATGTSLY